ncbi:MAG: acyloxyacyl hydrolase [Caulobacteraceae bacterium]
MLDCLAPKFWAGGALVAATVLIGGQARADEVWVGAYSHDLSSGPREGGVDVQLGYRTSRLDALRVLGRPSIDGQVAFNNESSTHFAAIGLDWEIGLAGGVYIRPGIGLAYTTGKAVLPPANAPGLSPQELERRLHLRARRIDFGSHVLFKPELTLGYRMSDRLAVEASYVHLSNGQVFHKGKNQGLDDLGARLVWRFGSR